MQAIDIGVNLVNKQFRSDLPEVLERARTAGVERLIVTGTSVEVSRAAAQLTEEHAQLWSTVGVHPHDASGLDAPALDALRELAQHPGVVAVGECGLDFDRNYSPPADQRRAFEAQLQLAADLDLPLFLHERAAHAELLTVLSDAWSSLSRGAVVHCFTGGPAEAEAYLELGAHLGITGWVCDERRGADLRAALPLIPADRLMLETDAPYLLPRDLEPKPSSRRNEPRHLAHVLARIAALRGEDLEEAARAAWDTTCRFFRLP